MASTSERFVDMTAATKSDLHDVKSELKASIAALRSKLKADMAAFKTGLEARIERQTLVMTVTFLTGLITVAGLTLALARLLF
ncbi:MAG: hypothetical protein KIT81_09565 [Alphaproteobacteria bacterium]|nr:hypothetical protein [Alphaproteobacteria bacterium]